MLGNVKITGALPFATTEGHGEGGFRSRVSRVHAGWGLSQN